MTPLQRILQRVDESAPGRCWRWQGAIRVKGYGTIRVNGREEYVHRVAWEAVNGPIPAGLVIDHLCRVRNCVNPEHLEPVTIGTNVLRGEGLSARAARRGTCAHGHDYTPENTYVHRGVRQCRICRRANREAARARAGGGSSSLSISRTPVVTP